MLSFSEHRNRWRFRRPLLAESSLWRTSPYGSKVDDCGMVTGALELDSRVYVRVKREARVACLPS